MSTPHRLCRLALCLLALWLVGCGTTPLPGLEEEQQRLERPLLLADLQQTAADLQGDGTLDRARLELVPGILAAPQPLGQGWLLRLERQGRTWLCYLQGGSSGEGHAELVAAGEQLRPLDLHGDRVLVLEEEAALRQRRLVAWGPDQGRTLLAEGPADRLRLSPDGHRLLQAEVDSAPHFREEPGSWHLERSRQILRQGSGWQLGKAVDAETPYRCLVRFVQAARAGRWGRARDEVVLERLLALPGGGYSRELAASLRLSAPALLDGDRPLKAPAQGEILRFEDLAGHAAWRVRFEERLGSGDQSLWKLVRLETVEKP